MADDIKEIQGWLNKIFSSKSEWVKLDEDGIPGWGTVRGIVRGLQLELGLKGSQVDGVFGNSMLQKVPVISQANISSGAVDQPSRIISLAQCALRVKGYDAPRANYNPPSEFSYYSDQTTTAVQKLRSDANYHGGGDYSIDAQVWKGLSSQDAYVLLPNGDGKLRSIQQQLNSAYQPAVGLNPADGVVTPQLSRALIKAVQSIVGQTPDGLWGKSTLSAIPAVVDATSKNSAKWAQVICWGLYINGYKDVPLESPAWGTFKTQIADFSKFLQLSTGNASGVYRTVIAALFVSHGDQSRGYKDFTQPLARPVVGIDLATRLAGKSKTFSNPKAGLSKLNIGFVGRYMQNAPQPVIDKELSRAEVDELLQINVKDASGTYGFGIAPIWQTSGNSIAYFSSSQGAKDAQQAYDRARELGIPKDVTIFYAVDFDAFGPEIESNIRPHFEALNAQNKKLGGNPVGVYGARAVCNYLSSQNLATASYVGNLSYGWTGNLGQPMPSNWAIDQYVEFDAQLYNNDGSLAEKIGVDQLHYSGEHARLWYR